MADEKKAWKLDDGKKIVVNKDENGATRVVLCDSCPCKNYLIVVRCDLSWEGPPECSCNPVDVFRYKISIVRAAQDENGVVVIYPEGELHGGRLGATFEDEAYGHVYHAIDSSDDSPHLDSYENISKRMTEAAIPPGMEYDTRYPAYYTYWGLRGIEACPCPCKYARVLACGVLEDGSSENIPYGILNWNRQDYVVRVSEWNDSVWLENPFYGSYKKAPTGTGVVRKWLKDCSSYPAEEVYGSDYLINNRLSSEHKRQSIKVVQLSELFETSSEASSWGSEWSMHQWAMLICATCECRCEGRGLMCAPAGYRVSMSYEATITDSTDYDGSKYTVTTTYKGHSAGTIQKYIHPAVGDCYPHGGRIEVGFPHFLEDGSAGFPVEVTRKTQSSSGEDSSDAWMETPNWVSVDFGTTADCGKWLPAYAGYLPGLHNLNMYNQWPEGKDPFGQNGDKYDYTSYWELPEFDKDHPWPHGSWDMNYNETETTSADMGDGVIYKTTIKVEAKLHVSVSAYFDEDYPGTPPASAAGCGAGAAAAASAPFLISANYRKFYNQLSEDLK